MTARVIHGDCLEVMRQFESGSVQTCVTSPPYYGLRDYGVEGQIGLEETPDEYVARLVEVFREVRRVLRDDGTLWLNIGDSYAQAGGRGEQGASSQRKGRSNVEAQEKRQSMKPPAGLKSKDLIGIPWMLAFALRADGWYLRQDIIWQKPNPMPESVQDRCTKAHEYVFLLSKSPRYYVDPEGLREQSSNSRPAGNKTHKYVTEYSASGSEEHRTKAGLLQMAGVAWETRNRRSVWTIGSQPFSEAHFATMPVELAETCILAATRPGDTVLDPFMGAFTTAYAALKHGREAVGAELNPQYIAIGERRIRPLLSQPLLLGAS